MAKNRIHISAKTGENRIGARKSGGIISSNWAIDVKMPKTDMTNSFEAPLFAIGASGIDIIPIIFERFFATFPDQRDEFHNLQAAAGRMANETIAALIGLSTDEPWVATTIINFVDLHRNYGNYSTKLYGAFVDIVISTIAEHAGPDWTEQANAEWQDQAARLKDMIATANEQGGALQ